MSDREALLETVFAQPADDAPRLVYADWRDEHGEPAQAAFIRAQVERARTDPDGPDDHLFDLLTRFQVELGPAAAGLVLWPSDFRRGFPHVPLHLLVSEFRDLSRWWWPRLPVRAVSIDLAPWNVGELTHVPYLERLRELVLRGADPHGMMIPRLARCHHLSGLRVLDLSQVELGVEAAEALTASEVF